MAGDREVLVLVGGFPPEPDRGDLDQLTSMPGPPRFLDALFLRLAATDVSRSTCRQVDEDREGDLIVRRFVCGTETVGYRQSESVALEPGDEPVHVAVETFGLEGVRLAWSWALDHQGQLGHCGYRHRALNVSFASAGDRESFAGIWTEVFGHPPVFASAGQAD